MALRDILKQSDFTGLSDADALALLVSDISFPGDNTAYTWSGIGQKLLEKGASVGDYINFTTSISALPGGPALDKCLTSGGFNFADPLNRMLIASQEVNEPAWAVAILEAMLAIGAPIIKKNWEVLGLDVEPTLTDVQNARAQITQESVIAAFTTIFNTVMGKLEAGTITTLEQAKTEVSGG